MKISVVTVCYNSEKTIKYTVNSFLEQTYPDKELIIVDGGSTDETLEIVQDSGSPQVHVVSEPDQGIYDAMNKGLRLFEGDAVGFLNSDDTFHDSSALSLIAAALQTADVVFGDLHMVKNHDKKAVRRIWRPGAYHPNAFQLGWAAPHPTFYVKRAVAEKVGEYATQYKMAADYDYIIRALTTRGISSNYIPHTLVDFQLGGTSSVDWKATFTANMECRAIRRRRLHAPAIDAALFLRPLRRMCQRNWTP